MIEMEEEKNGLGVGGVGGGEGNTQKIVIARGGGGYNFRM